MRTAQRSRACRGGATTQYHLTDAGRAHLRKAKPPAEHGSTATISASCSHQRQDAKMWQNKSNASTFCAAMVPDGVSQSIRHIDGFISRPASPRQESCGCHSRSWRRPGARWNTSSSEVGALFSFFVRDDTNIEKRKKKETWLRSVTKGPRVRFRSGWAFILLDKSA